MSIIDIEEFKMKKQARRINESLKRIERFVQEEQELKKSFEEQEKINKANQERLEKEREQANKNVLRSYRLGDKL
jgi:hypothetical protein